MFRKVRETPKRIRVLFLAMMTLGMILIAIGVALDVTNWNRLAEYGFLVNIYSSITTFMFAVPAAIWIVRSIESATSRFEPRWRAARDMAISLDSVAREANLGLMNVAMARREFEDLRAAISSVRDIPEWASLGQNADEPFDAADRALGTLEAGQPLGSHLRDPCRLKIERAVGEVYLSIQYKIRAELSKEFSDSGPSSPYAETIAKRMLVYPDLVASKFAAGAIMEHDPEPEMIGFGNEDATQLVRPYILETMSTSNNQLEPIYVRRPTQDDDYSSDALQ